MSIKTQIQTVYRQRQRFLIRQIVSLPSYLVFVFLGTAGFISIFVANKSLNVNQVLAVNHIPVLIGIDDLIIPLEESGETEIFIDSGTTAIGAVTLTLVYDESMIELDACSFSVSDYQGACNISESGTIKMTGINIDGVMDRSILATLEITPKAVGVSQIEIIEVGAFADVSGVTISPEFKIGEIVITSTQSETPSPTPTSEPLPPLTTSTPFPPSITLDEFEFLPVITSNS